MVMSEKSKSAFDAIPPSIPAALSTAASHFSHSAPRYRNQFRRSIAPRIIISLLAVWLAASITRPTPENTTQYSPTLGHSIPTDKKYGLSPEKLAIIWEPRHVPHLAFVLLHFVNVLPFDWPVLYIGTHGSIARLNDSYSIQIAQQKGRLTLQEAPSWSNMTDEDTLQRMFARTEFYNSLPTGVEHLFMAGSDSVMCSASLTTMDDWLNYDWVGSPWVGNSWQGGYNGYSLRRVSTARKALKLMKFKQEYADDSTLMETVWGQPTAVVPEIEKSNEFVMESGWVERPMAYHPSAKMIKEDEGWLKTNGRKGIWDHCPEVKVIMHMKLNRQKCPDLTPQQQALAKAKAEEAAIKKEMEDRDKLELADLEAEEGLKRLHESENHDDQGKAMLHGEVQ